MERKQKQDYECKQIFIKQIFDGNRLKNRKNCFKHFHIVRFKCIMKWDWQKGAVKSNCKWWSETKATRGEKIQEEKKFGERKHRMKAPKTPLQ